MIDILISLHRQEGIPLSKSQSFYGEGLEYFHGYWEALTRIIRYPSKVSWKTHYKEEYSLNKISTSAIVYITKFPFTTSKDNFHKFWMNTDIELEDINSNEKFTLSYCFNEKIPVIMIIGKTLPGFDLLVLDNIDGKLFLTLIQTKWAEPNSSTIYGAPDIESILEKMREVFKPFVKDYQNLLIFKKKNIDKPENTIERFGSFDYLNSNQIKAVFVLFANTTGDLDKKVAQNVLILNKEKLQNIYGPTIWNLCRPLG